jgi:lipoyl(octanoyl) transferase
MDQLNKVVIVRDLGKMEYRTAWDYQEALLQQTVVKKTAKESTPNYLLLVEHPPVYTLGKSGDIGNLLLSDDEVAARGIDFFRTNRGGDITFHGPGQIVGYPVFDLENFKTDIGWYLRSLEEVIIQTLADYGISAGRSSGETGVWLEPETKIRARKICAMGVRCSRWVTMHGFALNVNTDLSFFNFIIPCGIQDKQVASLNRELGRDIDLADVKEKLVNNFEQVFDAKLHYEAMPAETN